MRTTRPPGRSRPRGPHSLPLGRDWLLAAAQQIRPLLVVACLAYHLLAAATVLLICPWRRVGAN